MIRSDRYWLAAHAALLLVALSPIIVVTYVPLLDLPEHTARILIVKNLQHSPDLQRFYYYKSAFVPYLAFDVFTVAVGRWSGIYLAAKLFCIVAAGMIYIGTVLLHRTLHKRFSVIPMAAVVLIYNGAFLTGLVDYELSVGLCLCAVAAWIGWRNIPLKFHAPLFGTIAIGLMTVHVFGYALFGVEVLGLEVQRALEAWRRQKAFPRHEVTQSIAAGLAPAILPLALFFITNPTTSTMHRNVPSSLFHKAEALAEPLLFYVTMPEVLTAGAFIVVFLVLFLLRIVVIDRRIIIALGLLMVFFLLLPRVLFSGGEVDYRITAAIAVFGLASLDWHPLVRPSAVRLGSAAILCLDLAKIVTVGQMWLAWQPALAAYPAAFEKLPPGATMLSIDGSTGSTSLDRRPPVQFMGLLAAARGVFVPTMAADVPNLLLHFQPAYRNLRASQTNFSLQWEDYVKRHPSAGPIYLLVNRPQSVRIPPEFNAQPVASGPTFVLYRLEPNIK